MKEGVVLIDRSEAVYTYNEALQLIGEDRLAATQRMTNHAEFCIGRYLRV